MGNDWGECLPSAFRSWSGSGYPLPSNIQCERKAMSVGSIAQKCTQVIWRLRLLTFLANIERLGYKEPTKNCWIDALTPPKSLIREQDAPINHPLFSNSNTIFPNNVIFAFQLSSGMRVRIARPIAQWVSTGSKSIFICSLVP